MQCTKLLEQMICKIKQYISVKIKSRKFVFLNEIFDVLYQEHI